MESMQSYLLLEVESLITSRLPRKNPVPALPYLVLHTIRLDLGQGSVIQRQGTDGNGRRRDTDCYVPAVHCYAILLAHHNRP